MTTTTTTTTMPVRMRMGTSDEEVSNAANLERFEQADDF
jgi:hypothetical protein